MKKSRVTGIRVLRLRPPPVNPAPTRHSRESGNLTRIRNPNPHPCYPRVAPPNQLPTLVPMRSLPNQLIAGWKRPLLLAVVAAALILSLGSDCGPAAEVEFGYNYEHVTPRSGRRMESM